MRKMTNMRPDLQATVACVRKSVSHETCRDLGATGPTTDARREPELLARGGAASSEDLLRLPLLVAEAFAGMGAGELLQRGREALRDPVVSYGPAVGKLPAAMALALLRPLRLLSVAGHGPECVGQLPFMHVRLAARCCATLRDTTGADVTLRDWLWVAGLRQWAVDEHIWLLRRRRAQDERRHVTALAALAACRGSTVAAVAITTLTSGAMDGARAVELIFDDGQVVEIPQCGGGQPLGQLLGARLDPCTRDRATPWRFVAEGSKLVTLPLDAAAGVRLQPSPLTRAG